MLQFFICVGDETEAEQSTAGGSPQWMWQRDEPVLELPEDEMELVAMCIVAGEII